MKLIKYKRFGLLLALSLLPIIPVVAQSIDPQSTDPQQNKLQLSLMAQVARTHLLTPPTLKIEETIDIDQAQKINIIFGSPSKTLKIELISPSGQRFSSDNRNYAGVSSLVFPDPADPNTTGANYTFVLSNPQPGKWSYIIQETAPLTTKRAVLMSLFSSSSVRAGMLSEAVDNQVNRNIPLALVVADGQNVLKNVSINATLEKVSDPAFPKIPVNFHDDGANGDTVAGDGLFTASVKSGVPGEFQVFASIAGTSSKGSPFQRTAATNFRVNPDTAHFSGSFTTRGIDTNGDRLFEQIGVSPTVEVIEGGNYNVIALLKASNGKLLRANTKVNLTPGTASPELKFQAEDIKNTLQVSGPYKVSAVFLQLDSSSYTMVDRFFNLGDTPDYNIAQLQREAIETASGGTAVGVDTNGNGKFNYLDVTIPVNLLSGSYYNWGARLVDKNHKQIDLASGGGSLSVGNANVTLRFNGAAIGQNGIDGPYSVQDLIVYGGGKSLSIDDALTTQHFQASQFEGFVSRDQEPPKLSVSVTPNTIWPPNHQMVEIKVNKQVSDNVDPNPTVSLVSITSNEGQNVKGDGNTSTDIEVKPDGRVFLRAERSGTGTGRVYTLTYTARDTVGNVTQATAQVGVPRNKGK